MCFSSEIVELSYSSTIGGLAYSTEGVGLVIRVGSVDQSCYRHSCAPAVNESKNILLGEPKEADDDEEETTLF